MAYRGGAGQWIAIAFLGIASVFFGALYFSRETRITELENHLRTLSVKDLVEQWGNNAVREEVAKTTVAEAAKTELEGKIKDLENKVAGLETSLKDEQRTTETKETELKVAQDTAAAAVKATDEMKKTADEVANKRNTDLEERAQKLDGLVAESNSKLESLQRKLNNRDEEMEFLRKAAQTRVLDLQRENGSLREVIDKWSAAAGKREAVKSEQYDGRIIQVDIENKFVVVDIGFSHKVRRGMRFDAIRWRLNKWDYMAQIELTKVDATTSQGVILDAVVIQRYCPLCGYIANDPEEQVCPHCRGGSGRDRVVDLVKGDAEEKPSMKKMDPVLVGDYITNPFYSKDRTLRFVVAGDPQRYSVTDLKGQIDRFGGVVQDKVDVDTDYLVLGMIPEEGMVLENEDMKKRREVAIEAHKLAREYGIPIMREVELFNFLRR